MIAADRRLIDSLIPPMQADADIDVLTPRHLVIAHRVRTCLPREVRRRTTFHAIAAYVQEVLHGDD